MVGLFFCLIFVPQNKTIKVMARKIYATLILKVIINVEEGIDVDNVISEMDYDFTSNTDGAEILDTEINGYEITDSK